MTVHPAAASFGIWFRRTDIENGDTLIPARYDMVPPSQLCTKLRNEAGVEVSSIMR